MRAFEIITEDAKTKSMVMRSLNKLPDDAPIFQNVYKQIIGEPLGNRLGNYINTRGDQDAINAAKWLVAAIPTLGNAQEVKDFIPQAYSESINGDDTFIGLNYNAIVAALVKAIQEQQAQIEELKQIVATK